MGKRRLTVQDLDQEAATVLMGITAPPSSYTFTREEAGAVVTYIIYSDGIELGRLIFTPGTRLAPEARFTAHATALDRGVETSWQKHGTVTDLPDDECERHREFVGLINRIRGAIEFRHGLGMWAEVWEGLGVTPAEANSADTHEIYVPKRPSSRAKWKKTYPIIKRTIAATKEDFMERVRWGEIDNPEPSWADYVAAIRDEGVSYGEKSIKRILKAGDAGKPE